MTEHYGDYEVESFLGKGSIGKVFLARHRRIGRRVALKTEAAPPEPPKKLSRWERIKRWYRGK